MDATARAVEGRNRMRLIDADALIEKIDGGHLRLPTEMCFNEIMIRNMIDSCPTIEPESFKGEEENA